MSKKIHTNTSSLRRILTLCAIAALLGASVFSVVHGYFLTKNTIAIETANALDSIDERMESLSLAINLIPRGTGNDVLFLSNLTSLTHLIASESKTQEEYAALENDFRAFLEENTIYDTIEYRDVTGAFVAGASFEGVDASVTRTPLGEDVSNVPREHLDRIPLLHSGEVYISPITLMHHKDSNSYKPMLYYGTPIIEGSEMKGMVLARVYADYFLDDIRHASKDEETIFLVDTSGQYLAHSDRSKEYGMVTGSGASLFRDYPEVSEHVFSHEQERHLKRQDDIVTVRYIHPTISSFEVYRGSEKIFGQTPEAHYFWVLISVSDTSHITRIVAKEWREYRMMVGVTGALLVFACILFYAATMRQQRIRILKQQLQPERSVKFFLPILGALFFAVGYFFVVTAFFGGWQYAKWFDAIPDLLIFVAAVSLVSYARKFEQPARRFMMSGGVLLAFENLVEVVIQEYQVVHGSLGIVIWGPAIILEYIALFLLLIGVVCIKKFRIKKS